MGELSVFVNHTYGSERVFYKSGSQVQTLNWTNAVIPVGSHRNFNVSFVGTLGKFNLKRHVSKPKKKFPECTPADRLRKHLLRISNQL